MKSAHFTMRWRLLQAIWTALPVLIVSALGLAGSPPLRAAEPDYKPELLAPPVNGELAFAFSVFHLAIYPGMAENCPDGYAGTSSENYLASLPADERVRLSRPENEPEFAQRWKASIYGPDNTNICSNYDNFPERPIQRGVAGKTALGLDLDGDDGAGAGSRSCPHQSFFSPEGDKGIDNQAYRVMGCMRMWRGPDGSPGDFLQYQDMWLSTGEYTVVLILRGVESLRDDNDVEVVLASSTDPVMVDAAKHVITGATFKVSNNPRWRAVLHGRIKNGVLTTEPADFVLDHGVKNGNGPRIGRSEWEFTRARLQLAFQPDGTLKGVLGGYLPVFHHIMRSVNAGVGAAVIVNYDCAAAYNTLRKMADGGRDPATGQCTTISSAYEVAAVPAFVTDVLPATRIKAVR